jgi:predicted unusual protein kinase regulating ubiquinone biosynthesis (AarF/ABC1/UbiB family)
MVLARFSRFCREFSSLQDQASIHSWECTQAILNDSFGMITASFQSIHHSNRAVFSGSDWQSKIELSPRILGSGCIAQVQGGPFV